VLFIIGHVVSLYHRCPEGVLSLLDAGRIAAGRGAAQEAAYG